MVKGPEECDSQQIYNPESKRCIAIDGATGKKLLKAFAEGKVTMSSLELKKVAALLEKAGTLKKYMASISDVDNKKLFQEVTGEPEESTSKKTEVPASAKKSVVKKAVIAQIEQQSESLSGKVLAFSGFRSDELKAHLESMGATVVAGTPKNLSLVVYIETAKNKNKLDTLTVPKIMLSTFLKTHKINIKVKGVQASPPTLTQPPVSKPAIEPPVMASVKQCQPTEILSPKTNKCIKLGSPTFKKLVKELLSSQMNLKDPLVTKFITTLGSYPASNVLLPKEFVAVSELKQQVTQGIPPQINALPLPSGPNQEVKVSDPVKKKILSFVQAWKKQKDAENFIDDGHKKYCKSKKLSDLQRPVVSYSAVIHIPVQRMQGPIMTGGFSVISLNSPKQSFMLQQVAASSFNFNNYSIKNLLHKGSKDSLTYFESIIDYEWLQDMNKYVLGLSTKDLYTMIGYTYYGDTISNNYLRRSLNKNGFQMDLQSYDKWWVTYYPLFFQALDELNDVTNINEILKDGKNVNLVIPSNISYAYQIKDVSIVGKFMPVSNILLHVKTKTTMLTSDKYAILYHIGRYLSFSKFWQRVIVRYISDLDRIIDDSPPLRKPLVVYRGVKHDYYLKGKEGHVYRTDSFVSTSVNLSSALKFAGVNCCFKRITLLPGSKALMLAGVSKFLQEIEMLLGTKSQFYITKDKKLINKNTNDMCRTKAELIMVTDAVVIK